MSKEAPTSPGDKLHGKAKNANDQDEIASYAESTIKEMLGWYGLHDQSVDGGKTDGATSHAGSTLPSRRNHADPSDSNNSTSPGATAAGAAVLEGTTNGWNLTTDAGKAYSPGSPSGEVGLAHQHLSQQQYDQSPPSPPVATGSTNNRARGASVNSNNSNSNNNNTKGNNNTITPPSGDSSGRRHSNRKLVGMRYLFPALGEDVSLYERAKIWVARHDHKYFIGYTDEQLNKLDPRLRPLAPITPELYKLHMNRSEYCRNVKLKYCLECKDDWAQEFRDKLKKPGNQGGFTGLCQVKIAAAELWRKFSENYKGHQARYPNPKSKFKSRRGSGANPADLIDFADGGAHSNNEDNLDIDDSNIINNNKTDHAHAEITQAEVAFATSTTSTNSTGSPDKLDRLADKTETPHSNSPPSNGDHQVAGQQEQAAGGGGAPLVGSNGHHHPPQEDDTGTTTSSGGADMGVLYIDESRTADSTGGGGSESGEGSLITPPQHKEMSQRSSSLHSTNSSMVSTEDARARTESSTSMTSSNGRGRSESNVSVLSTESEVMAPSLGASSQASSYASTAATAATAQPPHKDSSPMGLHHSPSSRSDVSGVDLSGGASRDDSELLKSDSRLSPGIIPQRERSQSCIEIGRGMAAHHQIGPLPHMGMTPGALPSSLSASGGGVIPTMPSSLVMQQGSMFIPTPTMMPSYPGLHEFASLYPTSTSAGAAFSRRGAAASISAPGTPSSGSSTPTPETQGNKKPLVFRSSEYKKSERGLSFLFPSLADQQLSLLDKVRITVLRHKHNYFLGWPEEILQQLDPLVRPKMPVNRQLYKEYCHRNAMKYDSNLQFALESTEAWADEFRSRLTKPPSEGGFHSLCEVKQEAGRLWREYSGRYKMHNVVKSQMDLNSEISSIYLEGDLKEDFSSRAKQKMGESSGDILTDPMTRARPRAISDLTDDRSLRYTHAYMRGAAAAVHRLDFSSEPLTSTMPSGADFQRCRSPLNVAVGEEACNISRRSSYVTSEESVSQGRSANSSPSPSSRSALSSPGPQPPSFISSAGTGLVTSRSANSSPLNVHATLACTLTSSGRTSMHAHVATTDSTAAHHAQVTTSHASRKRSFEHSAAASHQDRDSRADSSSPTIKSKTSRISVDSDSRSPDTSDLSTSTAFDKHSRKRSSGTSIESSKSEYDGSTYSKDMSPSRLDRLARKREFEQIWDDDLANTETLFKPLPTICSVSEQLGIWMQRHRHNYFRNYASDDLLQVQPRVRPQYLVTPEIYRRFISENMVSMFGKVNEILESDTPWAKTYQSRVDQAPDDGGFHTIEEALTEALDLWAKYVESGKDKPKESDMMVTGIPPGWKHKREKAMERTNTPECGRDRALTIQSTVGEPIMEVEEGMARERSSSWPQDPQFASQRVSSRRGGQQASKVKVLPAAAWPGPLYATAPNLGSVGFLPTVGEFKVKQEMSVDDPAYAAATFSWSHAGNRYGHTGADSPIPSGRRMATAGGEAPDLSTEVLDLRRDSGSSSASTGAAATTSSTATHELQIRSAAQLSRELWGCRAMLQKVLSEDASTSWHSRLSPHMGRLHAQLGANYMCPASSTDCMVDLLLATLDQQLSKL